MAPSDVDLAAKSYDKAMAKLIGRVSLSRRLEGLSPAQRLEGLTPDELRQLRETIVNRLCEQT